MGILKELVEGLNKKAEEREEMDDDQTRDKFLRSLRRQRRTQREFIEKQRLQKEIHAFELERTRNTVVGKMVDDDDAFFKKKQKIKNKIKKKIVVMKAKQFMIPKKKAQKGFLSKGII